jgi:hypothetical protein
MERNRAQAKRLNQFSEAGATVWKSCFEIRDVAAVLVRHKNRPMLTKGGRYILRRSTRALRLATPAPRLGQFIPAKTPSRVTTPLD